MRNVICIPAYRPDQRLTELINTLEDMGMIHIVITDDGSGCDYTPVFVRAEELGCVIVHHEHNLGKGAALRTGIEKAVTRAGSETGSPPLSSKRAPAWPARIRRPACAASPLP